MPSCRRVRAKLLDGLAGSPYEAGRCRYGLVLDSMDDLLVVVERGAGPWRYGLTE